jgi:hypothetical protein
MTPLDIVRFVRTVFCPMAIAALAACGGGGSGGGSGPTAQTLGPAGGSVTSSDGKVTVSVGANALQAPAAVSIVPGTADAATAADLALVPGTTYAYAAPDIQVPDQVLIAEGGHDIMKNDLPIVAKLPLDQTAVGGASVKGFARTVHRHRRNLAGQVFFDQELLGRRLRFIKQPGLRGSLAKHGEAVPRQKFHASKRAAFRFAD